MKFASGLKDDDADGHSSVTASISKYASWMYAGEWLGEDFDGFPCKWI